MPPEGASCAVADEWNDEPDAELASLCNRIVRRLKGTLIESSEFWFDAQHATNGVAQSLSPYDLATHSAVVASASSISKCDGYRGPMGSCGPYPSNPSHSMFGPL